jgi:hypothetical protein
MAGTTPSKGTSADMRLKANTGKAPVFGSPEWRAKYGMKAKKKKPTTTGAAGASKSPAFGTPEWRAKYAKRGK